MDFLFQGCNFFKSCLGSKIVKLKGEGHPKPKFNIFFILSKNCEHLLFLKKGDMSILRQIDWETEICHWYLSRLNRFLSYWSNMHNIVLINDSRTAQNMLNFDLGCPSPFIIATLEFLHLIQMHWIFNIKSPKKLWLFEICGKKDLQKCSIFIVFNCYDLMAHEMLTSKHYKHDKIYQQHLTDMIIYLYWQMRPVCSYTNSQALNVCC